MQLLDSVIALASDLNIHGISGSKVLPHGKVYLTLSYPLEEHNITAPFYIVSQVSLQADFLNGFPTMHDNLINIFPTQNQISQRYTFTFVLPFNLPLYLLLV